MIRNVVSRGKHIAMLVEQASESAWPPVSKLTRKSQNQEFQMPLTHVRKIPGNYFMPIYRAFNHWLNVPEEKFLSIEDIMHTCHSAVFLLDDIEDGTSLRRGVPAAHTVYSLPLTINAGVYGFAIVLQKLIELDDPQAVKIYSEGLVEGHRGQGIEIYWRDSLYCPTEKEYIDMVKQKTSVFFTSIFQLLQLFSETQVDGTKFANLLGVYYQVRDDYCHSFNLKEKDNRASCSDITEGKFTLPIIHALQHPDRGDQVLQILKQHTHDPILKKRCISILKELGSIQYTREVLEALESSIYSEMEQLGDNPLMAKIMVGLSDWRRSSDDHAL